MNVIDQLKTPQGRIPVHDVRLVRAESPCLEFVPANAAERFATPNQAAPRPASQIGIEDLAFVDKDGLLPLALQTGPLFGADVRESLVDWQSAANVARAVVTVQEVVNGGKPLAVLRADEESQSEALVAKTLVKNVETGNDFSIFAISFAVDAARENGYVAHMPSMPWLKKFVGDEFDYVIGDIEHDPDGIDYLTVTLFSFEREITPLDFALVLSCFYDGAHADELIEQAKRNIAGFAEEEDDEGDSSVRFDATTVEGKLDVRESVLTEEDVVSLRHLVQALISLHLEGVRVDLFRSTEDDDFLSFDTYLAYLWFLFSKKLGDVKIGYCARCGKAFSLARRRGVPKKFCSEECKTAAKNDKTRQLQIDIRQAYAKGDGVSEIAAAFFPKQASGVACDKVRHMLATWVELKHDVDDDIAQGAGDLAKRCIAEGVFDQKYVERRMRALKKAR